MNITVYDLLDLFLTPEAQEVTLWDSVKQEDVFTGTVDDMPEEYQDAHVLTIDNIGPGFGDKLVLNIDLY